MSNHSTNDTRNIEAQLLSSWHRNIHNSVFHSEGKGSKNNYGDNVRVVLDPSPNVCDTSTEEMCTVSDLHCTNVHCDCCQCSVRPRECIIARDRRNPPERVCGCGHSSNGTLNPHKRPRCCYFSRIQKSSTVFHGRNDDRAGDCSWTDGHSAWSRVPHEPATLREQSCNSPRDQWSIVTVAQSSQNSFALQCQQNTAPCQQVAVRPSHNCCRCSQTDQPMNTDWTLPSRDKSCLRRQHGDNLRQLITATPCECACPTIRGTQAEREVMRRCLAQVRERSRSPQTRTVRRPTIYVCNHTVYPPDSVTTSTTNTVQESQHGFPEAAGSRHCYPPTMPNRACCCNLQSVIPTICLCCPEHITCPCDDEVQSRRADGVTMISSICQAEHKTTRKSESNLKRESLLKPPEEQEKFCAILESSCQISTNRETVLDPSMPSCGGVSNMYCRVNSIKSRIMNILAREKDPRNRGIFRKSKMESTAFESGSESGSCSGVRQRSSGVTCGITIDESVEITEDNISASEEGFSTNDEDLSSDTFTIPVLRRRTCCESSDDFSNGSSNLDSCDSCYQLSYQSSSDGRPVCVGSYEPRKCGGPLATTVRNRLCEGQVPSTPQRRLFRKPCTSSTCPQPRENVPDCLIQSDPSKASRRVFISESQNYVNIYNDDLCNGQDSMEPSCNPEFVSSEEIDTVYYDDKDFGESESSSSEKTKSVETDDGDKMTESRKSVTKRNIITDHPDSKKHIESSSTNSLQSYKNEPMTIHHKPNQFMREQRKLGRVDEYPENNPEPSTSSVQKKSSSSPSNPQTDPVDNILVDSSRQSYVQPVSSDPTPHQQPNDKSFISLPTNLQPEQRSDVTGSRISLPASFRPDPHESRLKMEPRDDAEQQRSVKSRSNEVNIVPKRSPCERRMELNLDPNRSLPSVIHTISQREMCTSTELPGVSKSTQYLQQPSTHGMHRESPKEPFTSCRSVPEDPPPKRRHVQQVDVPKVIEICGGPYGLQDLTDEGQSYLDTDSQSQPQTQSEETNRDSSSDRQSCPGTRQPREKSSTLAPHETTSSRYTSFPKNKCPGERNFQDPSIRERTSPSRNVVPRNKKNNPVDRRSAPSRGECRQQSENISNSKDRSRLQRKQLNRVLDSRDSTSGYSPGSFHFTSTGSSTSLRTESTWEEGGPEESTSRQPSHTTQERLRGADTVVYSVRPTVKKVEQITETLVEPKSTKNPDSDLSNRLHQPQPTSQVSFYSYQPTCFPKCNINTIIIVFALLTLIFLGYCIVAHRCKRTCHPWCIVCTKNIDTHSLFVSW